MNQDPNDQQPRRRGRPRTRFPDPHAPPKRKYRKKVKKPGKLAHVTLLTGAKGMGFCGHKQRWYVSYLEKGELSREFLPAGSTEEQAIAERERRYMELAMLGAKVIGKEEEELEPLPPHPSQNINRGIAVNKRVMTIITYRVILKGRFYGEFKSVMKAREVRDQVEADNKMMPCAVCGQKPTQQPTGTGKWTLTHKCDGNDVRLTRIAKTRQEIEWNTKLYKGVKP